MNDLFDMIMNVLFCAIVGAIAGGLLFFLFFEDKGTNIYLVSSCQDLYNIKYDLDGIYIQTNDIDCKDFILNNE